MSFDNKLEYHQIFSMAREFAWRNYNKTKLEAQELKDIYAHNFLRDKYIESEIEKTDHETQIWDFIFTAIEKMVPPHNPDTKHHG